MSNLAQRHSADFNQCASEDKLYTALYGLVSYHITTRRACDPKYDALNDPALDEAFSALEYSSGEKI